MTDDVDVVVVGAGPVGLAAAAFLGAADVSVSVLDAKPSTSTHPRASGVHGRTMEVFQQLGIGDAVRAKAVPPHRSTGFGWFTSLGEEALGELRVRG